MNIDRFYKVENYPVIVCVSENGRIDKVWYTCSTRTNEWLGLWMWIYSLEGNKTTEITSITDTSFIGTKDK